MNKYKLYIKVITFLIFISISILFIFNNGQAQKTWAAYFAPSSTDEMYGGKTAALVQFDRDGNVQTYDTNAYPFSGLVNLNNKLLLQTKKGTAKLENNNIEDLYNGINDNTVGYNMSSTLDKSTFYFLCNGTFKKYYYSSKLIIGNENEEYVHELKGFINSYGNDTDNIYLLTDDMKNRNNKQIQKISVNSPDKIDVTSNNISFNYEVESNFKMVVTYNYIFAFVIRDRSNVSILKISKTSLELEDIIDCLSFDKEDSDDSKYPLSTNSIFFKNNKIYYPSMDGILYSFNIDTNEFSEEFQLKDYNMTSSLNSLCCYDEENNELNILYLNDLDNTYYLNSYTLKGKLKKKIKLASLKLSSNLYPHNFIVQGKK